MIRHPLDRGVSKDAQNNRIHVLRHGSGEVGDRFAHAETYLVAGLKQARSAELRDTGFEAYARSQRRFLEHETNDLVFQAVRELTVNHLGLESGCLAEQVLECVGIVIDHSEKMAHWLFEGF